MKALPNEQPDVTPETETPIASPTSRSREWAVRTALVLFGITLGLAVIEVGFRLLPVSVLKSSERKDRPRRYFYPEHAATMRDFNYSYAKAPGTFRMFVVGDSFTFGTALHFDDTFSKRLERILNHNVGSPKAEVINYGVPGYSSAQEVVLVKRALRRDADLVLVELTLNDSELKPFHSAHPWIDARGNVVLHHWIFNYWKSFRFLVERMLMSRTHNDLKQYYRDLYDNPEGWKRFQSAFREMRALANEKGVPLAVAIFPLFHYAIDDNYPFREIHEKISEMLDHEGIPHLDLRSRFYKIPVERLQIIPGGDSHPNEIAHRIAAESIYRWLETSSLLPPALKVRNQSRDRHGDPGTLLKHEKN